MIQYQFAHSELRSYTRTCNWGVFYPESIMPLIVNGSSNCCVFMNDIESVPKLFFCFFFNLSFYASVWSFQSLNIIFSDETFVKINFLEVLSLKASSSKYTNLCRLEICGKTHVKWREIMSFSSPLLESNTAFHLHFHFQQIIFKLWHLILIIEQKKW